MQRGFGFDCLYFTTRMVGGGSGGRDDDVCRADDGCRDSTESPLLVLRFERYVSKTISFKFFGEDDDTVVLRWLSISSKPVGSCDILSVDCCGLQRSVRRRRTIFRTMRNNPTINGIVIAQTINIKTSDCI